ncbi:serine/threonine-protein kinase AFC2 isoform X2 [Tanacetum coccineum]
MLIVIHHKRVIIQNKYKENLVGILHGTGSKEVVIVCHGLMDIDPARIPMVNLAAAFANERISAFRFDFAGNLVRYEGSFQYGNYYREVGDLRSVMQHFEQEKWSVTAIIGHSKDVNNVVNIFGRFDLRRGIEGRLGKDYLKRIKQYGIIDVSSRKGSFQMILRVGDGHQEIFSKAKPNYVDDPFKNLLIQVKINPSMKPPKRKSSPFLPLLKRTLHLLAMVLRGQGTFGLVLECWDKERKEMIAIKVVRGIKKYRKAAMIEVDMLQQLGKHDKSGNRFILCSRVQIRNWFNIVTISVFLRENILLMRQVNVKVPDTRSPQDSSFSKRVLKSSAIKVINFGSTTYDRQDQSYIVSTHHYRAPEVILGHGWSYPCDIWSVGCILVELCSDEALFQTYENLEHLAMMERVLGSLP